MQAVVKAKAEPGLWLEEVPIPEVRGDDVRIRVLKTSICGTDVHICNWDALGPENDSCVDDDRP
jgi:threonine 3-dehydrogenase